MNLLHLSVLLVEGARVPKNQESTLAETKTNCVPRRIQSGQPTSLGLESISQPAHQKVAAFLSRCRQKTHISMRYKGSARSSNYLSTQDLLKTTAVLSPETHRMHILVTCGTLPEVRTTYFTVRASAARILVFEQLSAGASPSYLSEAVSQDLLKTTTLLSPAARRMHIFTCASQFAYLRHMYLSSNSSLCCIALLSLRSGFPRPTDDETTFLSPIVHAKTYSAAVKMFTVLKLLHTYQRARK